MKFTRKRIILYLFCISLLISFSSILYAQEQSNAFTTEDALNVQSLSVGAVTDDGRYIAAMRSSSRDRLNVDHMRYGDPTYISPRFYDVIIINTETKEETQIFKYKVQVSSFEWSPDNKTLAFFLREGDNFFLHTYEIGDSKAKKVNLKSDKMIASNSPLLWRKDGSGVILGLRDTGWAEESKKMFLDLSEGPVIIQDSRKPFLAWEVVRDQSSWMIPAVVNLKKRDVRELLPAMRISQIRQEENGDFITYIESTPLKTVYDRRGGTEYELFMLDMAGNAEPKTVVKKTTERLSLTWNNKNDTFAYSKKGNVFVQSVNEEEGRNLTEDLRTKVSETDTSKLRYSAMRWKPDNSGLMISSQKGYHIIDPQSGSIELVYEFPEDRETAPNLSITSWSPDGRDLYMTYSAKDKWERGLVKYNLRTKQMTELVKDSNLYSRWTFTEDGERIIYNFSDGNMPNELFIADKDLNNRTQLTDLNPWLKEKTTTRSELIEYLDVDGSKLYGILYYPANYEPGKKYPLVCEIYERFFSNGWNVNMNLITNAGFFAFRPSVNLEEGFPGEAWIKGVTTGINKLIDHGFIDEDKLAVHGTSYGGYATNLLITQTDRFAAACNISGKVNIISFLGDSPKITTRNYAAAEVGQDRIGATLWEQPQKYIAHTAIMFADRIKTPLLMLSGEGDWNVPATNQREMYYALRRLGKECVWVHYMNAGHGAGRSSTEEDFHHHWKTLLDFYQEKFDEVDKEKEKK
ncbi:S9 family peptidase [candidate division KSB1 bacterium]